jgi:hypothetical protein
VLLAWFAALDEEAINSPEPIQRRMGVVGALFGAQICAFWLIFIGEKRL